VPHPSRVFWREGGDFDFTPETPSSKPSTPSESES
jgi:hypothetical protein